MSFFQSLNRLLGKSQSKSLSYAQEVVTPQALPSPPTGGKRIKTKKLPKIAVRKGAGTIKNKAAHTAHATRAHLKTTHGKISAAQGTAILILFALFLSGRTPGYSEAKPSAEATPAVLRNYSPIVRDSIVSKPFEEATTTAAERKMPLHAWLTPWNMETLSEHMGLYSSVSAFWLTVEADGSTVTPKLDWKTWDSFRQANKAEGRRFYLTVNGDPDAVYLAISSIETQQKLVTNLLNVVRAHGFDGIDINFEGLGFDNRDGFTALVRNLTAAFHADQKQVAATLEARIANQVPMDWRALGGIADELRIMAYDYHARSTSRPGPVAPLGWVKEVADYATQLAKPEKIVIGLGNYGYDWQEPEKPEDPWIGTGISHERAVSLAAEKQAPVLQQAGIDDRGYDIGTIPSFTYADENGKRHEVWFENKQSLQEKISLLNQYSLGGAIFWSVGLGDQDFWTAQAQ